MQPYVAMQKICFEFYKISENRILCIRLAYARPGKLYKKTKYVINML